MLESSANAPAANLQKTSLDSDQGDYSKYQLYSRSEILFLLRALIQKKCMLTAYFDHGRSFFLTSLVALSEDGNWLYLDYGSDPAINAKALTTDKLILTTMLDKVKVQFSVAGLQQTSANGQPIFAARTPETILRLQRREFYRLTTPIANPLKCLMPIVKPDGTIVKVAATLLDISGGGVGLMVPTDLSAFVTPGAQIDDCTVHLPEEGAIHTGLTVRSAFNATSKAGHPYLRLGCEFVSLPGTQLAMIQRYITRMERERKAKEADL